LYQGLQIAKGEAAPSRDIAQRPEFARYVEDWGRAGDTGFVAYDAKQKGELLGAVWLRIPMAQHASEAESTPELAFVVKPGHRRHGIGAALLTQLVKANPQQSMISIRAPADNPAVRLYERFGFKIVQKSERAVTMRREA
jgi:GNAT superfamily N-acetyltransferase